MSISLLNQKHTKTYIKNRANHLRSGRFTRISRSFLVSLECEVEMMIDNAIKNHPSLGKTLDEFRK